MAILSICLAYYVQHWNGVDGIIITALCLHLVVVAIRDYNSTATPASRRMIVWSIAATFVWGIRWFLSMTDLLKSFRREHFYFYEFIAIGLTGFVIAALCVRIKYELIPKHSTNTRVSDM